MLISCSNKSGNKDLGDIQGVKKKDALKIQPSNKNVIDQNTISPYKRVDSLIRLLNKNFTFSEVKKLESICSVSDGDLTEYLDGITIKLLNDHLSDFLGYLESNPKSCLQDRMVEGLGANYFVYEKDERFKRLREDEDQLILIAKKQQLNSRKIKLIIELFKKVNPNSLD